MTFLYTGAYTEPPLGRARGIEVYRYDDDSGAIEHIQTVDDIANPTFLATSEDDRHLYAVCEETGGAVAAFARNLETGRLTPLNRQPSGGNGPCHLSVHPAGAHVLVANYGSGSVAVLPIVADGSLEEPTCVVQHTGASVNPGRQEGPHAHMILTTPDGRYVLATDLGADEVITYTFDDESGTLTRLRAMSTAPGAGPRHIAFSPDRGTVYVINELDNTLDVCDYDASSGVLSIRQTITSLPDGYAGETYCAHVIADTGGQVVYGSNRGHDSIVTWAVDAGTGSLRVAGFASTEGSFPRNFALDPDGNRLLVVNQKSDTMAVLIPDPETGLLSREAVRRDIPSAVCLLFVEA